MFTSDPTSDSSDTGASGKSNDDPNSDIKGWDASSEMNNASENGNQPFPSPIEKGSDSRDKNCCNESNNDDTMKSDNVSYILHYMLSEYLFPYIGNY